MSKQYYILAFDRTVTSPFLFWWMPNNCGYTQDLNSAGVYSQEQIDSNPNYYNNDETKVIPVEKVEKLQTVKYSRNDANELRQLGVLEDFVAFRSDY